MLSLPTRSSLLLHGLVIGMSAGFRIARGTDSRFRRALEGYRATYLFRAGAASRQLIVGDGRIRTRAGRCAKPDCEIVFYDLSATLKHIREQPDDRFGRLSDNRIEQIGNKFYVFKLGYLGGLCEKRLRDLTSKMKLHGIGA